MLYPQMMCSRCLLLILVVYFLMDELYAFLIPDRLRMKRVNITLLIRFMYPLLNRIHIYIQFWCVLIQHWNRRILKYIRYIKNASNSLQSNLRSDQEMSHIYELSDLADLFPGNEGEMTRDWDPNPAKSPAFFSPLEHINAQPANSNRRKNKDKRSVGIFTHAVILSIYPIKYNILKSFLLYIYIM